MERLSRHGGSKNSHRAWQLPVQRRRCTQKISSLSGGEKARVSLSKLMLKEANMLILDEPTNHLDLFAKEVLEAALMDYEGTLLFISHDRYFLNKMAERIVELHPGGTEHYLGNYDDYIEKKQELEDIAREAEEAALFL